MEEKNTSNKGLYIIIIILLIIVIAMVGYIGYKSLGLDSNTQTTNNDNQATATEEVDYTTIFNAQEELDKIVGLSKQKGGIPGKSFGYLRALTKINNYSEITNELKLRIAFTYYDNNVLKESDWPQTITKQEIENAFNMTALSNMGFEHGDIMCAWPHVLYSYDATTGIYTYDHAGHGAEGTTAPLESKMVSFKEKDNKYIISYKAIWGYATSPCYYWGDGKIWSKYKDGELLTTIDDCGSEQNFDLEYDNQIEKYFFNNYETIKDKLSTYTYTFEKTDNGYKLIDYIVK
ncbi:MAG: hypothetical protein Q4G04_05175 [bacterium]|nr:hypothetical protein [bacterium]